VVGTLSGIAALSLGSQAAWADSCTPPNGSGPTGSAASTFTYQCTGTYTGDWTNAYYVYDPTTGTQTALYTPDYSYDCTTGTWTQAEWDYDVASGAYIENRVAATSPPDQATDCPVDSSSSTPATTPDTSTTPTATPGTGSDGNTTSDDSTPANTTATNGVTANNTVGSQSQSGNASVENNDTAGNATTGDATAEVNVANLVQSLSDTLGSGTATFTSNVDGDVNGNIVLDPSTILADAGSGNDPTAIVGDTDSDASIDNDIDASSTTGSANVTGNDTAGNATTGDADTIVNLINMIDSAVAAGQSFIGTININGDLNGNILIPQSVIDELLVNNGSSPATSNTTGTTDESITNNVDTSAASGDATVSDNGVGGNATSGNASTNVTVLNLTGSSVIGKNVLLVFVNVLGNWVGMIVNAPTGATSAEFGGGITSDSPSTTTANNAVETDTDLSITNNVTASAASGDALVAYNRDGGNATSGNADTAVNILNMENSDLSLANWFGILFINVFGTWNGNFGILPTPATATPNTDPTNASTGPLAGQTSSSAYGSGLRRFATFMATDNGSGANNTSNANATAILGDATVLPTANRIKATSLPTIDSDSHASYVLPAIALVFASVLLLASERDRFIHHKN